MPIKKVEEIKQEAKLYYKNKNMIFRYILIGFLFILLILQFLLPSLDKDMSKISEIEQLSTNVNSGGTNYNDISILNPDVKSMILDRAITSIAANTKELQFLHKNALLFLPDIEEKLNEAYLDKDFKYIAFINKFNNPFRDFSPEIASYYGLMINEYIDERLNQQKATDVFIAYISDLYNEFKTWDLTVVGYIIGKKKLETIMHEQNQTEFKNLYFEPEVMSKYYDILAYKHIMENISEFITIDSGIYIEPNVENIKLRSVDNLIKRANKNGYTFKEIKELNPWILGNKLPKGNWNIKIYSE